MHRIEGSDRGTPNTMMRDQRSLQEKQTLSQLTCSENLILGFVALKGHTMKLSLLMPKSWSSTRKPVCVVKHSVLAAVREPRVAAWAAASKDASAAKDVSFIMLRFAVMREPGEV